MGRSMMHIAGVDGCKGGWLMVRREAGGAGFEVHVAERWRDLPAAAMTAVDMPVGLPDRGARGCDRQARDLLGPRRNSVFLGLRRPLLGFGKDGYPAANAWAKSDGAGLSKQAWNLLPKVRELDEALSPADQDRVRETHPELAFRALNGGPMEFSKRDPVGFRDRYVVLERAGFAGLDGHLRGLDRKRAAPDDLLDACALAWSAARMLRGEAVRVPPDPPRDARGLRMEIWY